MNKFDDQIRPQDDFYHYINNGWINSHKMPDDKAIWGSFNELRDKTNRNLRKIINLLFSTDNKDLASDQLKIKTFYQSAINFNKNKTENLASILEEIVVIDQISSKEQVAGYLGKLHRQNATAFWSCYVDYDDKDSSTKVFRISQGGLRLPNRDYYLQKDKQMENIRNQYKVFFDRLNKSFFANNFNIKWSSIIDIETKLAKLSWPDSKLRDVISTYNKFEVTEFEKYFDGFDWKSYFINQNWENPKGKIIVNQPDFLLETIKIIDSFDLEIIKDYLKWSYINKVLDLASQKYSKIFFDFYGAVINGKERQTLLWKRVIWQMYDLDVISESIAKEYISKYFPESSKEMVFKIACDIKDAFSDRIDSLNWMDDNTKKIAHRKLDKIDILVGYPDKWRNIVIPILSSNHVSNTLLLEQTWSDYCLSSIGKKPDRHEWHMDAHAVNACSEFNQLTVCFPAGILQPPFFDKNASYASNLGSFGSIVGHELTHSFDDQGIEFDENGNLNKWLTKSEQERFKKSVKKIIDQANGYQIMPDMCLDGDLVAGEAVADLGGIEVAVSALKNCYKNSVTNDMLRQLFESYTKSECSIYRDEALINLTKTDPHPPSIYRVNGVLAHIDEFYNAYDIKETDQLYLSPDKRAKIW